MKNILLIIIAIGTLTIASCTHRGRVTMNTIRPADITLSSDIQSILLLDRTLLDPKNKLGVLEGLLTGELPYEDKAAVQRAIAKLNAVFQTSPRFTAIVASERLEGNSISTAFPAQLDWATVDRLCKNYGTQAILSIEIFDTDFIVTDGKRKTTKTVGEGENAREVEVDEWFAKGVANVTMGIRFYDAVNKTIVDEEFFRRTNTWEAAAASKAEAIARLVTKSDASARLCEEIGEAYAYKVTPLPVRISRMYYRKHKKAPAIQVGSRMADVNRWEDALKVWEQGIHSADFKRAGYLSYNTAIAWEVLGDLNKAVQYAQDSYIKYNNKEARAYVNMLQNRIADEERLKEQQQ